MLEATSSSDLQQWVSKIEDRTAVVGIVGLGYVGLPLTLMFSETGFAVRGFDIDSQKVDCLNRGQSYIHRIEPRHIQAAQTSGFRATSEFSQIADVDVVLICVPTPLHPDHTPDMSYVVSTMESLAPFLHEGQMVILESTTYPGTTEELVVETINRHGASRGVRVLRSTDPSAVGGILDGVMVAFSPEREDPGNMITPRKDIPKIIGAIDERARVAASALYGSIFTTTVPVSSPATAEMTKLLENIYRSVNIALVNELKQLCQPMGIDVWEVINAAATKPFGFHAFYPGPGVGGHCIPVDPFYLSWKARQFGFSTRFIELAGQINESMPDYVVDTTRLALVRQGKSLCGASILLLGLAYKRDVDDLRESPSLRLIELLSLEGAKVEYNDPFFPTVGHGRHYHLEMTNTELNHLQRFDCVLIATDHSHYDMKQIVQNSTLVIDTRNATRHITSDKIVRC